MVETTAARDSHQRRRMRWTVFTLSAIALGLYFGFILFSVLHAHH